MIKHKQTNQKKNQILGHEENFNELQKREILCSTFSNCNWIANPKFTSRKTNGKKQTPYNKKLRPSLQNSSYPKT